jgi:LysR family transcriptional regulator, hydrogen peroxide-inducible genes activator
MELHQLEYLLAVAEEGSVTRAAERLTLAQPSLSQQLRKLEREVGQPLFDRLPRGVVLTEAGRRLVEDARRILASVQDARRHVADARRGVGGPLIVGAIPTVAPFVIPRLAAAFLGDFPEVELTLIEDVTQGLVDRLERAQIDLALASSVEASRRVLVERVATEPLWLLVPDGHRLASRPAIGWSSLRRERFLVLQAMHCLAGQVQEVCAEEGLAPRIVSQGAQLATIAAMVSAGLGLSIVPEMMRAGDAGPGRVYRPFAGSAPTRELNLLWSPDRYRTNAAREFARLARGHLNPG